MASEVLFKSSAFCYAIVILKRNKGKNEQRPLQLAICFQYDTLNRCRLFYPVASMVKSRGLSVNVSVPPCKKPRQQKALRPAVWCAEQFHL